MEKIKKFFGNFSLKSSFIFYTVLCLLIALLLSLFSFYICEKIQNVIFTSYEALFSDSLKKEGSIILNDGTLINEKIYFYSEDIHSLFSAKDNFIYNFLEFLKSFLIPFWFILMIIIESILFYSNILNKPIKILTSAAENISENNLDFNINYKRNNEMGKLCSSFEKMRTALIENNYETWRKMNDHKKLNASFSHDLRTPITVLKGQTDLLLKYIPEGKLTQDKIISGLNTLNQNIQRLENYTETMNRLQRIEDTEIHKEKIDIQEFLNLVKSSGKLLCGVKEFIFITNLSEKDEIIIDKEIFMRIYENLISNAVRFAESKITVSVLKKSNFSITVSDDGPGFTESEIEKVTDPFYKTKSNEFIHFGLGLHICKILCEKHCGFLTIKNDNGAIIEAVF